MDLPLMTRLQEEHRAIAAVTSVIEDQANHLAGKGNFDAPLLLLALEYLRDFPEWHHHPREEWLFTQALDKDPLLERVFKAVQAEHDALPSETEALIKLVEDIDTVGRDRLATALRDYAGQQRKHMLREDRDIFPRLRGLLPAATWELPPSKSGLPPDPIIEGQNTGRFAPLLAVLGVQA